VAASPPAADLAAWADGLARSGGPFPLLGTASRAEAYPALLWNGTRLHRDGLPPRAGLLLLAHVVTEGAGDLPTAGGTALEEAVDAGVRVLDGLPADPPGAPASAGSAVLAAAATAAHGSGAPDPGAVLDLAGTLAVVGPSAPLTSGADVRAGHALAVGWLAVRLLADGLVAPAGAARATASTVLGAPVAWPESWT
jgi:hypothetical protein